MASFALFSGLCKFGTGMSAEQFEEQVHTNLPIYVVHIADEDDDVSNVNTRFSQHCTISVAHTNCEFYTAKPR